MPSERKVYCFIVIVSLIVCETDDACVGFPIPGVDGPLDDDDSTQNMTCYKGGKTVFANHQVCDVTSASKLADFCAHVLTLHC